MFIQYLLYFENYFIKNQKKLLKKINKLFIHFKKVKTNGKSRRRKIMCKLQ